MSVVHDEVTSTIQLALAPVFLLSAVAALIAAISGRLARAVDRMRFLHAELTQPEKLPEVLAKHYKLEFQDVRMRGKMCAVAIFFNVLSGVLISLTVLELFFFESGVTQHLWEGYMMVTFVTGILSFMTALVIVMLEVIYAYWSATWNLPFHNEKYEK